MTTLERQPNAEAADLDRAELSVVMPCLNEAESLPESIRIGMQFIDTSGMNGEIVVADNGSTDGSQEIAISMGARVVHVPTRGYGNALRVGIDAAFGKYVIMGDADSSYDFRQALPMLELLIGGHDLVVGNRFRGKIMQGAMPWKHRYLGNPVLSTIGQLFFRIPVGDFHCGLRGFSRESYQRMDLCTGGMEFASEMIIKAKLIGMRIGEVPITLHPDGRSRPPHLRSWRDGWRHLKFMLLLCPHWLFMIPGILLVVSGLTLSGLLLGGPLRLGMIKLDIHTLLVSGISTLIGTQLIIFSLYTRRLAEILGLYKQQSGITLFMRRLPLEWGILTGILLLATGLSILFCSTWAWQETGFRGLNPKVTMRSVIPSVILIALGVQVFFGSFFLGFLKLIRHKIDR